MPENITAKPNPHGVNNMKILRFTASWCEPCKALSKSLEEANLNVPIEVIDIDVFPETAIDYSVRSVPTLVLTVDDKEIKRIVGVKKPSELKEWVANGQ